MTSENDSAELNPVAKLLREMIEVETDNLGISEEEAREQIETSLFEVFEAEREARSPSPGQLSMTMDLVLLIGHRESDLPCSVSTKTKK
jgi:predicted RNase H-like HicB family nuclease